MNARVVSLALVSSLIPVLIGCAKPAVPGEASPETIDVWSTEKSDRERLLLLLKPRTTTAEVLVMSAPPDLNEIGRKMKAAGQKDPATAMEIMQHKDADGVVIYDPRMGITREEYARLIDAPNLTTLKRTGEVQLKIERTADSIVRLTGLPQLSEVTFDAATLSVVTPYGKLENAKSVAPNDGQKLTGKIAGLRWRSSSVGSLLMDDRTLWTVLAAQSQTTREVWLEFRVKNNDTGRDELQYFVRFSGPK